MGPFFGKGIRTVLAWVLDIDVARGVETRPEIDGILSSIRGWNILSVA